METETIVLTEKYDNFNGRIITQEAVLIEQGEIPVKAQWDTGATYTNISPELAKRLNLKPCKQKTVKASVGTATRNAYEINVVVGGKVLFSVVTAEVDNLTNTGIDLLIGMDIIHHLDFAISSSEGVICFSYRYPSQGFIDFSKE